MNYKVVLCNFKIAVNRIRALNVHTFLFASTYPIYKMPTLELRINLMHNSTHRILFNPQIFPSYGINNFIFNSFFYF